MAQARFDYRPAPLEHLLPGGLYVLRGPRRVGKSVELKRAIAALLERDIMPRRIIHASVDGWRDADLGGLFTAGREIETRGTSQTRFWFIDEITSVVGDWASRIKWLRDNTAFRDDCVVLTGSSSASLDQATKALAGRRGGAVDSERTLLPMGFGAFCRAIGLDLGLTSAIEWRDLQSPAAMDALMALQPYQTELVNAWETYLIVGGFPQAVDDYLRHGQVQGPLIDALWDVVYGDAIRSVHFSATQTQSLLSMLATGLCSPVNVSRLASELAASRDAVTSRLRDLASAYLAWSCHLSERGAPKLRAQSKVYLVDPLVARLASLRQPVLQAPGLDRLSQQQLGMALARQAETLRPGTYPRSENVMFHRSATRREVDFVSPPPNGVPLESKYTDGPWRREAQTMRTEFRRGVIATRSVLELDDPIWAVPAAMIAVLLEP